MTISGFVFQSAVLAKIRSLERTDFSERDRASGEDHSAHVVGQTCISCGRPIEAQQAARRRGAQDWAHDMCPEVPG